jgi:hypothetical protein
MRTGPRDEYRTPLVQTWPGPILGTALLATTLLITGCGKDGGNSKPKPRPPRARH